MRTVSKALTIAVLLLSWAATASGQAYPSRSVRVIVPYPPGGGADFVTRVFSKALSEKLGQQFFIDKGVNDAQAPPHHAGKHL